jgi:signal transduction histidine kinase
MNAGKHSGAAQIDLYSEITDGEAVIHIRDRGVGYIVPDKHEGGLGMRVVDPIGQVGGQAIVASRLGEGTEVTIRVPCP